MGADHDELSDIALATWPMPVYSICSKTKSDI